MSIYGHDSGFNAIEVPSKSEFSTLEELVDDKQDILNATNGETQEDCDLVLTTGIYYISPLTLHSPADESAYTLFVMSVNEPVSLAVQMAISIGSRYLYFRSYSGGWSDWVKYLSIEEYQNVHAQEAIDFDKLLEAQTLVSDSLFVVKTTDSKKITAQNAGKALLELYYTSSLNTTNKSIFGAINELASRVLTLESQIPPLVDDVVFPEVQDE